MQGKLRISHKLVAAGNMTSTMWIATIDGQVVKKTTSQTKMATWCLEQGYGYLNRILAAQAAEGR